MFHNDKNRATIPGVLLPNPADYELGSLESRAAARARLDAQATGLQKRCRVIVSVIGLQCHLENCTCCRSFWKDGTLFEFVKLDGCDPDFTATPLDELVGKIPIDGKEYPLAEVGTG